MPGTENALRPRESHGYSGSLELTQTEDNEDEEHAETEPAGDSRACAIGSRLCDVRRMGRLAGPHDALRLGRARPFLVAQRQGRQEPESDAPGSRRLEDAELVGEDHQRRLRSDHPELRGELAHARPNAIDCPRAVSRRSGAADDGLPQAPRNHGRLRAATCCACPCCACAGARTAGGGAGSGSARAAPAEEYKINDALKPVYFAFDSSAIRSGDAKTLDASAAWLKAHPDQLALIEGHCDERGTNEYNLALGERRAKAAMGYLVSRGIEAGRITMISYGKERPVCTEHNEACWSKNRRDNFLTKKQ